jgi:MFS superfamily sulfate permease-like transporter
MFTHSFRFDLFLKLLLPSFSYFAVGIIELLLTMEIVHERTETPTVNPNQMVFATGLAITVAGLFGTMGGGKLEPNELLF